MSRASTLILLGILNMFVPFSGLPMSIRALFAVIVGVCVFSIGLSFRSQEVRAVKPRVETAGSDSSITDHVAEPASKITDHEPHKSPTV